MILFLPLIVFCTGFVLLVVVVDLASRGPLGVLAATFLVPAVALTSLLVLRRLRRWWAATAAPPRDT